MPATPVVGEEATMSYADIVLISVVAVVAFVGCFVHALGSDIAEQRAKERAVR